MSDSELQIEPTLLNKNGEPIENRQDFSGIAVETFSNKDKFDGLIEKGVSLTRKKMERESTSSQTEQSTMAISRTTNGTASGKWSTQTAAITTDTTRPENDMVKGCSSTPIETAILANGQTDSSTVRAPISSIRLT